MVQRHRGGDPVSDIGRFRVRLGEGSGRSRHGERGAILVLSALTSICLILSAAVTVDIGAQRARRAQYQAVADGAALLAIYEYNNGYTLDQVSLHVKTYVLRNLGVTTAAWSGCGDVKRLELFAGADTAAANECISFRWSTGPGISNLVRVKIPIAEWTPLFGLGLVTMRVSAVAGAEGAQGVCDEFDLAGCVTTTTTTTTTTTSTTTTIPAPPFCPVGWSLYWDGSSWICEDPSATTTSTSSTTTTTTKPPKTTTTAPPPPPSIEIEF